MMRKYETIFIQHPSLDEEAVKAAIEKFKGVIENGGGTIENVKLWVLCKSSNKYYLIHNNITSYASCFTMICLITPSVKQEA